jgi:hypothetical protein
MKKLIAEEVRDHPDFKQFRNALRMSAGLPLIHKVPENSAQWRKERPILTGVLDYFPDAIMEVAHCSYVGNEQHNPGTPLHWDRSKSQDEADALLRHLKDRGHDDTDGVKHSAKVAWRALALLQKEIEHDRQVTPADGDKSATAGAVVDCGEGERLSGKRIRELDQPSRGTGDVREPLPASLEYPVRDADSDREGVA